MLKLRANAKVNLFLKVISARSDGYHEIESVFHSISLYDELEVWTEPEGTDSFGCEAVGDTPVQLDEHDNTVMAAARSLQARRSGAGVGAHLRKRIPSGAGLGGGSADGAAMLHALNDLWDIGLSNEELRAVAADIGSDVPYCVDGGAALVTGRGEKVQAIPAPQPLWLVAGLSHQPLSTADVYRRWDEIGTSASGHAAPMMLALGGGDVGGVAASMHNDLETAAFSLRPGLQEQREAMVAAGAVGVLMSGSGPTILGLVRDEEHARQVAAEVEVTFDRVEVVSTRSTCVERL